MIQRASNENTPSWHFINMGPTGRQWADIANTGEMEHRLNMNKLTVTKNESTIQALVHMSIINLGYFWRSYFGYILCVSVTLLKITDDIWGYFQRYSKRHASNLPRKKGQLHRCANLIYIVCHQKLFKRNIGSLLVYYAEKFIGTIK